MFAPVLFPLSKLRGIRKTLIRLNKFYPTKAPLYKFVISNLPVIASVIRTIRAIGSTSWTRVIVQPFENP